MHIVRANKLWPIAIAAIVILHESECGLILPEPKVEILLPRGLRASIPDTPGLGQFIFHAAINRSLEGQQTGDFYGNITEPVDGRWVYENVNIALNTGDVLNFWVHIKHNNHIYRLFGRSITVPEIRPLQVENSHSVVNSTRQDYECIRVPSTARPRTHADRLKVTICLSTSTP